MTMPNNMNNGETPQQPLQPAQNPAMMQAPAQTSASKPTRTTVCGILGVVFGALALLLSFIPIINNFAAILGFIGVILAVIAIIGTFRGKKHGKALAVVAAVLSVLSIVITLAMQQATVDAIDEAVNGNAVSQQDDGTSTDTQDGGASSDASSSDASTDASTDAAGVQDMEGDLENTHVAIVSAARSDNDYEGNPTVLVTYTWTNNSDQNTSFFAVLDESVFQNGQQLDTAVYSSNPAGYDVNSSLAELQPGATGTVTIGYVLKDDSPVDVEVTALISFDDAKVSHTFTL